MIYDITWIHFNARIKLQHTSHAFIISDGWNSCGRYSIFKYDQKYVTRGFMVYFECLIWHDKINWKCADTGLDYRVCSRVAGNAMRQTNWILFLILFHSHFLLNSWYSCHRIRTHNCQKYVRGRELSSNLSDISFYRCVVSNFKAINTFACRDEGHVQSIKFDIGTVQWRYCKIFQESQIPPFLISYVHQKQWFCL